MLALAGAANAASTVRLVYGGDWSEAGLAVKRTLSGAAFKSAAKGRYVAEFVEETGGRPSERNLGSWKLPCAFLISESGNCYCVLDNIPSDTTAEKFVAVFSKADAVRVAAEKKGFATADDCGEFTGWQRHFTLGLEFDKSTKADGIELVIKANEFREKGDFAGGQAFIDAEMKKPRGHLTKEQTQGILMAKFALYREDASKKEEMDNILRKVAAYDETTLWGTAALGWLNMRGAPPLSAYWGWHDGDFRGPQFKTTVKYGVSHRFAHQGEYSIRFVNNGGSPVKVDSVTLYSGNEVVKALKNPSVEGGVYSFEYTLPRAYRGRITSMLVKGDAPASGNSTGGIEIRRRVLRPRREAK